MLINTPKLRFVFNNSVSPHNIFLGPFVGELGWELIRWSGMVRQLCKMYPEKNIHIGTRTNRRDLYSDVCSNLYLYDIEGDYDYCIPACYKLFYKKSLGDVNEEYGKSLTLEIAEKFEKEHLPDIFYQVDPFKMKFDTYIMYNDYDVCDFQFETTTENKQSINNILDKHKDKIPLVLFPRNRKDVYFDNLLDDKFQRRNWKEHNWQAFYDILEKEDKYIVFISGLNNSAYHPNRSMKNFIVLENIVDKNTSTLGLTIEAIKKCPLTVSTQSSVTVLSNLLKVPTLCFGNELDLLNNYLNPYKTKMIYAKDNFDIDPSVLYSLLQSNI